MIINGADQLIHRLTEWIIENDPLIVSQALNCTRSFALSCKYVAKENKYSTVEYCTVL